MKHNENKVHAEPPYRCGNCFKEGYAQGIEDAAKLLELQAKTELDLTKKMGTYDAYMQKHVAILREAAGVVKSLLPKGTK